MRDYYQTAQDIMTDTRDYFRIQRAKTRISNRMKRDESQNRFREHYKVGELVMVTRPSFTRKDGVKGIKKIVGAFRGPYPIVDVDAQNGVDVNIDGEIKHFNISQINRSTKLVDRQPPAFSEDSLAYDWDVDEPESEDLEEKVPDEKSEVLLPLKKLAKGPIDRKLKAPKKGARRFRILHDSLSKRNYAAELSTVDGIPHARLYSSQRQVLRPHLVQC
jgi:hypothetical protein